MSVPPTYSTTNALSQPQSILFTLPRELRDQIYHNLFLSTRYTYQPFPTPNLPPSTPSGWGNYTPDILQLRYRLPSPHANANPRNRPLEPCYPEPTWLFTCKLVMREALEQFPRNAEWFSRGYMSTHRDFKRWTMGLGIETGKVRRAELYVQNLANYEEPRWGQGIDTRGDLEMFAKRIRLLSGLMLETLRFVGHSYRFHRGNVYCDGQAGNMMRNLVGIFDGVDIKRWEFGIQDPDPNRFWALFEWVVEEGEKPVNGRLEIMVKERTLRRRKVIKPEEDLANLLPEGWVCKRPPCECEACEIERAEGLEGGWGRRPDVPPLDWHDCAACLN